MVNAILALPGIEQRDLSSVRLIIDGGEKMPIPLIERIQRTFPSAWFADAYGLTETVSGDTFLDTDHTSRSSAAWAAVPVPRARHLGRATARRCRRRAGRGRAARPEGVQGLLARPRRDRRRRSPAAGSTPATSACATTTATSSSSTAEGHDRVGGENIAGSEVERVLYEHDGGARGRGGRPPDERWGEVPIAFVVVREAPPTTADALVEHCSGQLAKFKVPKDVLFLDALPRNPSGKVLKRELPEQTS
jgi:acyl-CoA synthetase (AMP-forming)/AMP-acid ligase II